MDERNKT